MGFSELIKASADQGFSVDRYSVIPRTLLFLDSEDVVLMLKGDPGKKI